MVIFPKRKQVIDEVIPGLVLAYEKRELLTQVSALLIPVGALSENKGEEGLSHLIEHMVFRGTRRFPTTMDVMMSAEGMGGRINAYTTYDYMVFLVQMPATHWKLSLDLLFDLAFFPLFREEDLEVEKEVVLREMAMIDDDPSEKAAILFQNAMWGKHRLGSDVIGFPDVVKNITRHKLYAFWEERFLRYPVYLTTIGSVPYEEIRTYLTDIPLSSSWRASSNPWDNISPATFMSNHRYQKEATNQTYYRIGIELYPYRTSEWREKKYHISLITSLLGGTSFSKIVQEIRDSKGWAYSVGATVSGSVAGTSLIWYMDVLPGVLTQVKDVWLREIERLKDGKIEKSEFEKAKTYVIGSTMMSSDSMHSTALAHLMNIAFNEKLWDPKEDVMQLESLKLSDIVEEFRYLIERKEPAEVIYGSEQI